MDVRIHEQVLVLNDQGGAVMDISNDVTATLRAQDHGHPPVVCFSIGAMNSEGMLSSNPHAGIHQTDVARTIDASGSNPAGYQGGDVVCYDARGNGEGGVVPTITGDHENRVTDYTAVLCYNDRRRADYHIADDGVSPAVVAKYGTGGATRPSCY